VQIGLWEALTIVALDPRLRIARMTRAGIESTRPGMRDPLLTSAPRTAAGRDPFASFVTRVRAQVEAGLAAWLDERVAGATQRGADVGAVADALRQLTLRGGKRMRPVLLAAAYEGCAGEGGSATVAPAGVALELFQAYLLTHDDWMDGDDLRRGGPSVPAMMRERFGAQLVGAMSVLAGDLAAAWSRCALFETPLPPTRILRAAEELTRVEEEVVQGQVLDVVGLSRSSAAVEAVHSLKTASYTVRGPVAMGAHLAGASDDQLASLVAFAEPLGVAFQLRDDLLGVFGDANTMGKSAGGDLRKGRYSAVVVATASMSGPVERVFGREDASDEDVRSAIASLETSGVRAQVEARIEELARASRVALEGVRLTGEGRILLASAAEALTQRLCG
jgi:geranylgeranyl diphosphate synthase, type I